MSYQSAVAHWAVAQPVTVRYHFDSRITNHLAGIPGKIDACRLDPDSVSSVEFMSLEGGSCETCAYSYLGAVFSASCTCGKVKNKDFEIDMGYGKGLAEILAEVMACEPYNISEMTL